MIVAVDFENFFRAFFSFSCLFPQAQQETQKAALRYERAVSMHTAAREMVCVAEQGLLADRNTMDPTWQEMLNHATSKVYMKAFTAPECHYIIILTLRLNNNVILPMLLTICLLI